MPREVFGHDYHFLPKTDILTFEEIQRVARVFVQLGVEKIRLTGGEPLLRRDLDRLIAQLASIKGLRDLTLTTNGSVLAAKAQALRDAGLRRLTVSLDSLDDATFRAMNDVDFPVNRVVEGIEAAQAAGFSPIKINMVVRRGVNEQDIPAMARRFGGPEFVLRFIEYMDVGNSNGWRLTDVVSAGEVLDRVGMPLTPIPRNYPGETALRYRTATGGEIGIIASVTKPFCGDCTRARLAADGKLYTCLFASHGHDLRLLIRNRPEDTALRSAVGAIWHQRTDRYSELRTAKTVTHPKAEMSLLGG
jgi:GTP 3',8-cyclase